MNASSLNRRALGLLAGVALLLSCFLFSACNFNRIWGPSLLKDLFGDYHDQFPAVVLDSNGQDPVKDVKFDWNETTMGGASIKNFIPSKNFYRLNIYYASNGTKIYHDDFQPLKNPTKFPDLPAEKLLQVDLEMADDQQGTQGREIYSFHILFHTDK